MPFKQRLIVGGGLAAFFLTSCCVFSYLLFPYSRVRDVIVQEVQYPAGPDGTRRPSGVQLSIGELRPSLLPGGVTLGDVRFAKASEDGGDPLEMSVEEVSARVGIFALLGGNTSVSFSAAAGGGTIDGSFYNSTTETGIDAELEGVDLRRLGIIRSLLSGVPVRGKVDGTIELDLQDEREQTTGSVELTIAGLTIGDGRAKLRIPGMMGDGLTIEQIDVGDVRLAIDIDEGIGAVRELENDGEDITLRGSGNIHFQRPLAQTRLDLLLSFNFSDAYKDRNDRTRGMFAAMDFAPQLRPAKTEDGALQYRFTGPIGGRIAPTPAGRATIEN
jgi:type II secretion system protein N